MITPAPAARTIVVIDLRRKLCPLIPENERRDETVRDGDRVSPVISATSQLAFIIDPRVRRTENQKRDSKYDDKQDPCHG